MPVLTRPAFGPQAALVYITVGCLLDVWVVVWYFAFVRGAETPPSNTTWFWLLGLFFTGFTLATIGVLLGKIGQAARRAELPPGETIPAEVAIQKEAAAHPTVVAPPGTVVPATGQPAASHPVGSAPTGAPAAAVGAAIPAPFVRN